MVSVTSGEGSAKDGKSASTSTRQNRGSAKPQRCVSSFTDKEMPCRQNGAWWSNQSSCYIEREDPQPPKDDDVWEGHTNGAIYSCYNPDLSGTRLLHFWAATPPAGPAAPPDPEVLAEQAVAAMQLRAISIGIVPQDRPGSIGVIGLPTYMWATVPSQHTWGPITRTASAGPYRVTATGKVDRVVWTMGDGTTVVCRTPGTPYRDSYGKKSSPDCGHTYTRQGMYTVRATSYWEVNWSGMGQAGTIPLQFTDSTAITMGEVQVLVTG